MSDNIIAFPARSPEPDYRYELVVWLLRGEDHSVQPPRMLDAVWEVARCPWHMDWVDPLQVFPEHQRDHAVAWARDYAAKHSNHVFHGLSEPRDGAA
jgi:hypothetical protein